MHYKDIKGKMEIYKSGKLKFDIQFLFSYSDIQIFSYPVFCKNYYDSIKMYSFSSRGANLGIGPEVHYQPFYGDR